jgi:hypothetical protein
VTPRLRQLEAVAGRGLQRASPSAALQMGCRRSAPRWPIPPVARAYWLSREDTPVRRRLTDKGSTHVGKDCSRLLEHIEPRASGDSLIERPQPIEDQRFKRVIQQQPAH